MYTFSDVEYASWVALNVGEDRRPAFQARVKYLRRLGLLPNPGSGVRLQYTFDQAFELICALKLQDADVAPGASITTAKFARSRLHKIIEGDRGHILLIEKEPSRLMSVKEAQSLLGIETAASFLDLKLLANSVREALAESISRPKCRRLSRSRKQLPDYIYGERDGK